MQLELGRGAPLKLRFRSIQSRLLVVASVTLTAFFILTGLALESAFRESSLHAIENRLEGMIYSLLAAAAYNSLGEMTIADDNVRDERLRQPNLGVEAALFSDTGDIVWRTNGVLDIPRPPPVGVGEWRFEKIARPDVFAMSFGLRFLDLEDDPRRYTIIVVEQSATYKAQLTAYRGTLFGWLAASGAGLLIAQILTLRWGVSPLKRLVRDLRRIESGEQTEIEALYPEELTPLTDGLNAMIRSERTQQTRHRHALSDLAHTLKTPLAVIRGVADDPELPVSLSRTLGEQVGIMQQITDYQLRRAAAAGRRTLSEPIAVRPIVDKLCSALGKVYSDRKPQFDIRVADDLRLRLDSGDLYELLGNLLDNAVKYGGGWVRVTVVRDGSTGLIHIEDNGCGFPDNAEHLLERGVRADSQVSGQGIGLSAVYELVKACDGELRLGRGESGGGSVTIRVPA